MAGRVTRIRRARKTRALIKRQPDKPWLTVHRSARHIYLQVLQQAIEQGERVVRVIASASSLEKELRNKLSKMKRIDIATAVGKIVAERAVAKGVSKVAFDRSGYKYHGRVKAAADGAREGGLDF